MHKRLLFYALGYAGTLAVVVGLIVHPTPTGDYLGLLRWILLVLMLPGLIRLAVMIVVAPWNDPLQRRRDRRRALAAGVPQPLVSVIVPAWNEEVGIRPTVASLLNGTYRNLEVIVVNDGSTDRTEEVVLSMVEEQQRHTAGPVLVYLSQPNGGKSRAMNNGLRAARGKIVMTVDADSVAASDYVERIVERFADPEVMCVAGDVKIGNPTSIVGLIQKLEYLMGFFYKNADSLLGSVYIVGGAAAAYRRSVFDRVGLFAEDIITEDIEMSTRIQDAGYRIDYAPRAIVYTEGPSEIVGLAKQRLRWKHGRLITFWRYRDLFFSTRRRHQPWLTWVTLPLALLGDALLLFQPLIGILVTWVAFGQGDFAPMATFMGVFGAIALMQILLDPRRRHSRHLLWLVPMTWLCVMMTDLVELQALARSIHRLVRGEELKWQKWQRTGVFAAGQPALTTGTGDVAMHPIDREVHEIIEHERMSGRALA